MASIKEFKNERTTLVTAIQNLSAKAEEAGRNFTDVEAAEVEAKTQRLEEVSVEIRRVESAAKAGAELDKLMQDGGQSVATKSGGGLRYRNTKAISAMGRKMAETLQSKALWGLTEVPEPTDLYAGQPQQEFGEVGTLQNLIGLKQIDGREFTWIQEAGGYAPKAAVWTPESGLAKPEMSTSFTRKKGELSIVAVMSQALQQYDVIDAPELVAAIMDRMTWDLAYAETALVLNGDAAKGYTGLRNTSGTLVQAFVEDEIVTLRHAVGALESANVAPNAVVLNPVDWQKIELTRDTDGNYVVPDGPVDRAAKRIWGTPVVVSTQVAPGEAFVLNTDAVHTVRNGGVAIEAVNTHDVDFSHNRLRVRAEERVGVAVTKPGHIVLVNLTAA